MTIIYIFHSLVVFGGVERIFVDKVNYLAQQPGYNVYIITFEQSNHPLVYPLVPEAIHIDLEVNFYKQYQYGFAKRMWMQQQMKKEYYRLLSNEVQRIKPDIIIGASCETVTIEAMMRLKDKSKKIIETHSARESVEKVNSKGASPLMKLLYKVMDKRLHRCIKQSAAFVTLTTADAENWPEVEQIHVIPNILTYYPPQVPARSETRKKVVSTGRLTEQKGFDLLVPAWEIVHRTHPDWQLDIYGDGEDKTMIEQEIEQRGLMEVITIHNPTRQIYEKYQESDFYVMSSRWEGFGLVLSEAMSCGIPCISFDCPHGPSDIIRDGEDGLIVENGNIAQLAEKICYLIEHEDIRREMGRKARENVKRYLPENIMPQWEKLFNDLTTTL